MQLFLQRAQHVLAAARVRTLPVHETAAERPVAARAAALHSLGNILVLQNEFEAAEPCFERSLALREQLGGAPGAANLRRTLADLAASPTLGPVNVVVAAESALTGAGEPLDDRLNLKPTS